MRKLMLTLALCVALAALVGAAFAQNAPAPTTAAPAAATPATPPHSVMETVRTAPCILPTLKLMNSQMMQTLSLRLNLTDDQKTKVADLLDKADKDIKPKIEAQIKAGQDYIAQLTNTSTTQAELTMAADKAMKAESDVLMARIGTLFALRGLLTVDQNKQLSDRLTISTYPWREGGQVPGPPMPGAMPKRAPATAPATAPAPAK